MSLNVFCLRLVDAHREKLSNFPLRDVVSP